MTDQKSSYSQGGKANGLDLLVLKQELGFSVPRFDVLDTSYYDEFLQISEITKLCSLLRRKNDPHANPNYLSWGVPKRLEERCQQFIERYAKSGVAVRSSAVLSEDTKNFSGAGIYQTVFVDKYNLNISTFTDAVLQVFFSTNSKGAIAYRKSNNLPDEKMAVVVQELLPDTQMVYGVAFSRMPSNKNIIPVVWSSERGGAVQGTSTSYIDVHKIHFSLRSSGDSWKQLFVSDTNVSRNIGDYFEDQFMPFLSRLKKEYGADFEFEFGLEFGYDEFGNEIPKQLYALQIRPLTNVHDVQVTFPNKKPILEGEVVMNAGEYIGPWVTPIQVLVDSELPSNYALITRTLDKTLAGNHPCVFDVDELSPNKRAIVCTEEGWYPGMHALTVANEKNIVCIAGGGKNLSSQQFEKKHGHSKSDLLHYCGQEGYAITQEPNFKRPLNSKYVHIVSDGIVGNVYEATEQEAKDFAAKQKTII